MRDLEVGTATWVNVSAKSFITSCGAAILGVGFVGTGTGQVQFFAGATCSASMTPIIKFSGTASAVEAGLSPMFWRHPAEVSGNGFCVDIGSTSDPNIIIYWVAQPKTP